MGTTAKQPNDPTVKPKSGFDPSELVKARVINLADHFINVLKNKDSESISLLLTLPDNEFWAEVKGRANYVEMVENITLEKKEHEALIESRNAFLAHLGEYGGVYKSSKVADILGVTRPTVNKYGENHKLIVLNWGIENLYPVFQFSVNKKTSNKGYLKGVPEILTNLGPVSGVKKCDFFIRKIKTFNPGIDLAESTTVLDILRNGASNDEIAQLVRLAKIFDSVDSM
ncbi:hypothetical protein CE143_12040 [Photorhabdus luminescens]|uniref:DNA-binding protein n=1 Tax=Photorhabdus akhurstii TaxID=171438 RepID=A0ABX8LVJ4_9GAMM|nr:hypothetical protein [Photorhabdus akhurstii]QXF33790.1 hypothetical protein B0X70_12040 [Photorhabdus akhurstii]UJD75605.1 hypothetical protein CE143_12040 [Photorhabdus luminescens]